MFKNTLTQFIFIVIFSLIQFKISIQKSFAAEVPPGTKLSNQQILNVGIGSEISTLDPQKVQDVISYRLTYDLFEGLTTENEKGDIVPGIADKWEVSKNSLIYTFHIRNGAKFSDGSPITAEDVVFSFQRLVDPKTASPYSDIISMVKNAKQIATGLSPVSSLGVKAVTTSKVEISLNVPTVYFIKITALTNLAIVQKANVEKHGDQFTLPGNLVSSGAFVLKYWKIGDKLTTVRNKNYWNNDKTIIETVNYYPITDVNTELQMYQTGQIDFTYDIPSDKYDFLKKNYASQLYTSPILAIFYINLNNSIEPFKNNIKLRQALSMAIDRDVLVEKIIGRGEKSIYDIVPYGISNYKQNSYAWSKLSKEQLIAEAQKLYKEAGFSKDNPLEISYSYNTNHLFKKIAIAISSMWEKNLGVKVNLINQEWKVFLTERMEGRYVTSRDNWYADYNDASTFLDLFKSSNPQNSSRYKNFQFDELLKQASHETNETNRKKLLEKASALMLEDYPIIPLYTYVSTHLVKSYIGGYTGQNPLDNIYSRNFYIIENKNN